MKRYPHDPIEDDPQIIPLLKAASEAAHLELADHPRRGQPGFCHIFWSAKKKILKEQYSLDWKTPVEMDPYRLVMFD